MINRARPAKYFNFTFVIIFFAWVVIIGVEPVYANTPKLTDSMKTFQLNSASVILNGKNPKISWKDAKNNTLRLSNFNGKVILLNFWASWCLPCIRELPSMDRLQETLGAENFKVVAISLDRGGLKSARRLFRKIKIRSLELYVDKTSVSAKKLGVRLMPTTFIFDRNGRNMGKLQKAAEWDSPEALNLIKFFIDNPDFIKTSAGRNG